MTTVKQFLTYVNGAPFQPAVARALALPDEVYADVADRLQAGRDLLTEGLVEAGFTVSRPGGTYFVVADAAPLGYDDGMQLCLDLPRLAGVVAVPVRSSTTTCRRGRRWCGSRCASGRRCSPRRHAGWAGCGGR